MPRSDECQRCGEKLEGHTLVSKSKWGLVHEDVEECFDWIRERLDTIENNALGMEH